MKQLTIGDVTITSIIERDGPWRKPAKKENVGERHNLGEGSRKNRSDFRAYSLRPVRKYLRIARMALQVFIEPCCLQPRTDGSRPSQRQKLASQRRDRRPLVSEKSVTPRRKAE